MKTYVLLYFEYKNDITIITKLHRATRLCTKIDNDRDVIFMFTI